jgi:hypothetical protein
MRPACHQPGEDGKKSASGLIADVAILLLVLAAIGYYEQTKEFRPENVRAEASLACLFDFPEPELWLRMKSGNEYVEPLEISDRFATTSTK